MFKSKYPTPPNSPKPPPRPTSPPANKPPPRPTSPPANKPVQNNPPPIKPRPPPVQNNPPPIKPRPQPLQWASFDNLKLTDLQNYAAMYKTKSLGDINNIFIGRCSKNDQNNAQCKYDVELLSNIVYNIARMQNSKPKPSDFTKLPPKLREKVLEGIKPQRSQASLDFSEKRGISSKQIDLKKPSRPLMSPVTAINSQLTTLINKISSDRTRALAEKNPEQMKKQLQNVKKELNDYINTLSKSFKDINKYSPDLMPKYKQINSEYILLSKYINTYDDFLNQLIKLKDGAPKLAAKPTNSSLLNDMARAYSKLMDSNNALPAQYRLIGYVDKTPLTTLYGIKEFTDNKQVKDTISKYKINILYK
jgi:archaellum component FlaC